MSEQASRSQEEVPTLSVGQLRDMMWRSRAEVYESSVVAIYLGRSQRRSLLNDIDIRGALGLSLARDIKFDGVPIYFVGEDSHLRVVAERTK